MDVFDYPIEDFRRVLENEGRPSIGTKEELISRLMGPPLEKKDPSESISKSSASPRKFADLNKWSNQELIDELMNRRLPIEGTNLNWHRFPIELKRKNWIDLLNGSPLSRLKSSNYPRSFVPHSRNLLGKINQFHSSESTDLSESSESLESSESSESSESLESESSESSESIDSIDKFNEFIRFSKNKFVVKKLPKLARVKNNWTFKKVIEILQKSKDRDLLKNKLFKWLEDTDEKLPLALKIVKSHNVNFTDERGVTPLFISTLNQDYYSTLIILILGANPNQPVNEKNDPLTPLMVARYKGNTHIVKLLIQYGSNPFIKNSKNLRSSLL